MDGARADAEAALKLNPETTRALFLRSYLSQQQGKFDDSIADATAALRIDRKFVPAWSNRATAYLVRGDYRQAVADATRAIEREAKHVDAYVNRAGAQACLGEYDKALADYKTAIELAPNDPRPWVKRSALHIKMGNSAKAAADWEKAKALDPTLRIESRPVFPDPPTPPQHKKLTDAEAVDLAAALKAAQAAWGHAKYQDYGKAVEKAVQIDPTSAPAREMRARLWTQQARDPEDYQKGLKEAEEAIRLDPTSARAYLVRGTARSNLNEPARAIADLTIAIGLDPTLQPAWNNRGWAYLVRGQYHQGLADMTEAIRLKPDSADALANHGLCYLHLGDYKNALADYTRAADTQPTVGRWRLICAAIRANLGDGDGARKDRARAIAIDNQLENSPPIDLPPPIPPVKLDPELEHKESKAVVPHMSPAERLKLANLLANGRRFVREGQLVQLEPIVDEAIKLDPESPGALGLRAVYRLAIQADRDGARKDAEAALKLNPETFNALAIRGQLSGIEGKLDDAIADATVALRLEPKHSAVCALRAHAYFEKKEFWQTIFDATRAIDQEFRSPDPYLHRAGAYVYLGKYDLAMKDFDLAAKRFQGYPPTYIERSVLQAKLGHDELAAADWKKANDLMMGRLTDDARPVLPEPLKPVQRKKLTSEDKDALALALKAAEEAVQQQRVVDARKAIEKAIQLDPTSADAQCAERPLARAHQSARRGLPGGQRSHPPEPESCLGVHRPRGSPRPAEECRGGHRRPYHCHYARSDALPGLGESLPRLQLPRPVPPGHRRRDRGPAAEAGGLDRAPEPGRQSSFPGRVQGGTGGLHPGGRFAAAERALAADLCRHPRQTRRPGRGREGSQASGRCGAENRRRPTHRAAAPDPAGEERPGTGTHQAVTAATGDYLSYGRGGAAESLPGCAGCAQPAQPRRRS